jgi:hypothetical protein
VKEIILLRRQLDPICCAIVIGAGGVPGPGCGPESEHGNVGCWIVEGVGDEHPGTV